MYRTKTLKTIFILLVCGIATFPSCSNKKNPEEEKISKSTKFGQFKFKERIHDFGNIKNGDSVTHVFKFSNIGKVPLIIQDVSTSCGCTAVDYSKKPILPHAEGFVTVSFHKKNDPGFHSKAVIIKANTPDIYTVIRIKATI